MSTAPPLPDLTTQTTSSEIFSANHPLPTIRAIHKALHARLDDTAARLRTQVGSSYRELLGTADTIVAMRSDMDAVQASLGRMGGRCGRAVVARKVAGLGRFETETDAGGRQARERLLEGVVLALGGTLREKKAEGLVLAARLWVLGRLLVKSFGGKGGERVRVAERGLEGAHGRLLRAVEGVLGRGGARAMERGDVVRALAAYSLATSSGARDVLRQFLRVRGRAMAMAFEGEGREGRDVLRGLGLYTRTLQDVQALVPHRLMEALGALKKGALLADESLRRMEGLRLDVYGRWCGDEIQYYTPFIRHDDLDLKQARDMLASWAKEGSAVLLRGLGDTLQGMTEFKAIVELRTSVLTLWIQEGGKARGFDPSVLLDAIRDAINSHMLLVLEAKVSKLRLVGSEVSATLDAWHTGTTDRHLSLWDAPLSLDGGATQFTQDAVARLYGRNDAVSKAVTCYSSWIHVISDVTAVVDQLRRQRWDNDADADDIEDEDTIARRQQLLAKDDPATLHAHLDRALVKAFRSLDDHLSLLWKGRGGGGQVAMYLLRVLRDIRGRLPEGLDAVKAFGLASVPSLHEAVAAAVVGGPLEELATGALARKTVVGRSLWEGAPALPSSPSPGVFRFLRDLSLAMSDAGGDLWSPAAAVVLKRKLAGEIGRVWLEAAEAVEGEDDAAEGEKEITEEKEGGEDEALAREEKLQRRRDLFVQWLFDVSYLRCCLDTPSTSGKLAELEDAVYGKSGLEGTAARERVAKGAQEYWKRTSLLFGLLS